MWTNVDISERRRDGDGVLERAAGDRPRAEAVATSEPKPDGAEISRPPRSPGGRAPGIGPAPPSRRPLARPAVRPPSTVPSVAGGVPRERAGWPVLAAPGTAHLPALGDDPVTIGATRRTRARSRAAPPVAGPVGQRGHRPARHARGGLSHFGAEAGAGAGAVQALAGPDRARVERPPAARAGAGPGLGVALRAGGAGARRRAVPLAGPARPRSAPLAPSAPGTAAGGGVGGHGHDDAGAARV